MATKAIKFSNNTTTYLPVTDASLVQMKVGNDTKSVKEVIAAAYNELNDRLTNVETSYVKSIATSGTGTFINGVTIGNDSTGGKKLTFSYGTITSDVFITNVTEKSNGTYEADKTLTDVDIALAQGKDVIYIVNHSDYYQMSFYVPTQCAVAVRMNLNEPAMNRAKASYLYHSISDVTVGSLNLVDESNLKTINNTSLLGSGDISVQEPLTFDSTPTANSTKPVTSGGVYQAIQNSNEVIYMSYTSGTWNTAIWATNKWVYGLGGITFKTDNIYVDINSSNTYWYDGHNLQLIKGNWSHPTAAGTPTSAQSVYSVNIDSCGHSYSPIAQQHDPVTVTISQLKYDAGQTITLNDSFVNSALGSYTTTSLTGSSSNDYWKYTTSNN